VIAAFFMSQQAPASAEVAPAAPSHSAALDAALPPALSPAQLALATRQALARVTAQQQPAAEQKPAAGAPPQYTVRPGDSLSSIAGRVYHNATAWPVLYWGNSGQIKWANLIKAGQVLRVPAEPARIPAPPGQLGPPAPPVPAAPAYTPRHAAAAAAPAPAQPASTAPAPSVPATTTSAGGGGWPGGAFGACVVARESGGNPNIWNSTGHWGLYQFSASTWAAYGGDPAAFGNASVAVQEQVFMNALAQGGQSNWAPYDGC
jgi:LysM repeat protein